MQHTIVVIELYLLLSVGSFQFALDMFVFNNNTSERLFGYGAIAYVTIASPIAYPILLIANLFSGRYGRCYPYRVSTVPTDRIYLDRWDEIVDFLNYFKPNMTILGLKPAYIVDGTCIRFSRKSDATMFKMWL